MTADLNIDRPTDTRRPRIALLGEFSAGKSTLLNALMEKAASPVKVTATHVPPIWYSFGEGNPVRIARDGTEVPLDSADISAVPFEDTRCIRVYMEAEILRLCDLIDMPGSSDPNMTPDIWDAMLPLADGVVWCTAANQAWRQSEAAIWEEVPEALWQRSLLLLTRIDKVRSDTDRNRVVARIRREVDGLFRGVFPVSLLQALEAADDDALWHSSGMSDFSKAFLEVVGDIESGVMPATEAYVAPEPEPEFEADFEAPPEAEALTEAMAAPEGPATADPDADPDDASLEEIAAVPRPSGPVVLPRRITPRRAAGGERPRRASSGGSLI